MLITTYRLEVDVAKHSTEEFEYEAIAYVSNDIREILPYLNATLKSAVYLPEAPSLSWRLNDHKVGFWPDRIAADHLESREQASGVIEKLVSLVNDTWENRRNIEPDVTTHDLLQPLELYRLLPKTNCKACGEASCFSFALKLAAGQTALPKCAPLATEFEYQSQKDRLEYLMATKRPLL
jgi:ArsR family metal-binding transcriptional regulator